jgi:hypothetical protein
LQKNGASTVGFPRSGNPKLGGANKTRNPKMAEALFWKMLDYFQSIRPDFGGGSFRKMPRRFKTTVYAMDSTTIRLFANCMYRAKHRRRKAAAKLHLCLNLQCFLPAFAVVDSAKGHDNTKARVLCAGIQPGEIVVFDMAYIDYDHLFELTGRDVFWVSRVKSSMKLRCIRRLIKKPQGRILRDDLVVIESRIKRKAYPQKMRRVSIQNNHVNYLSGQLPFWSNKKLKFNLPITSDHSSEFVLRINIRFNNPCIISC